MVANLQTKTFQFQFEAALAGAVRPLPQPVHGAGHQEERQVQVTLRPHQRTSLYKPPGLGRGPAQGLVCAASSTWPTGACSRCSTSRPTRSAGAPTRASRPGMCSLATGAECPVLLQSREISEKVKTRNKWTLMNIPPNQGPLLQCSLILVQ